MCEADIQELGGRLRARLRPAGAGCLVWANCTSNRGFGRLRYRGRHYYTHRLAYELGHGLEPGSLPRETVVVQSCRDHRCCEDRHLSLGVRTVPANHPWRRWEGKAA